MHSHRHILCDKDPIWCTDIQQQNVDIATNTYIKNTISLYSIFKIRGWADALYFPEALKENCPEINLMCARINYQLHSNWIFYLVTQMSFQYLIYQQN